MQSPCARCALKLKDKLNPACIQCDRREMYSAIVSSELKICILPPSTDEILAIDPDALTRPPTVIRKEWVGCIVRGCGDRGLNRSRFGRLCNRHREKLRYNDNNGIETKTADDLRINKVSERQQQLEAVGLPYEPYEMPANGNCEHPYLSESGIREALSYV